MVDGGCLDCDVLHVATIGSDDDDGSAEKPFRTIQKALDRVDSLHRRIHVAGGTYDEVVAVAAKKLTLQGGFLCNAVTCDWTSAPDPIRNLTVLKSTKKPVAGGALGVATLTVNPPSDNSTLIRGLRVVGYSGALGPVPSAAATAVLVVGATPTFETVAFDGGEVSDGAAVPTARRSIGLLVAGTSVPNQSVIVGAGSKLGGGTSTASSVGLALETVGGNPARISVSQTTIHGGSAPESIGVLANASGPESLLEDNDISSSATTSGGDTASWAVIVNSSLRLWRNRINAGLEESTTNFCPGVLTPCGGIQAVNATNTDIQSNLVGAGPAQVTIALLVTVTNGHSSSVVVNGNVLRAGNAIPNGKIRAALGLRISADAASNEVGVVRNNILLGGKPGVKRYGVLELNEPNLSGGLKAFTNNDVFDVDIAYQAWSGTSPTNYDIFGLNVDAGSLPGEVKDNISADPLLTLDGHLNDGSPCLGKGTFQDINSLDIDGQKRTNGNPVEIGPDEK